jgi:general secretion pathway protein L
MQPGAFLKRPAGTIPGLSDIAGWVRAWRQDLIGCLPATLRKRIGRLDQRIELAMGDDGSTRLELVRGPEREVLDVLAHPDPESLRRLAARPGVPLVLVAASADVLCRRVAFPAQVKDSLSRVLGYELDRLTPFQPHDVFVDHHIVSGRGGERIEVELALVKRNRVERWIAALGAAGASPAALTWPDAWPGANLLPPALRGQRKRGARYLAGFQWLVVILLALAVVLTPLWQRRAAVIDLGERLAAARAKADKVLALRERLDKEVAAANMVVDKKRGEVHAVEVLRRLTEEIPDDAYVTQFSLNGRHVELRGEAAHATALIETLSHDPVFRNAAFRSPVVGVRNTDRERFHIGLEIGAPEAKP